MGAVTLLTIVVGLVNAGEPTLNVDTTAGDSSGVVAARPTSGRPCPRNNRLDHPELLFIIGRRFGSTAKQLHVVKTVHQ